MKFYEDWWKNQTLTDQKPTHPGRTGKPMWVIKGLYFSGGKGPDFPFHRHPYRHTGMPGDKHQGFF